MGLGVRRGRKFRVEGSRLLVLPLKDELSVSFSEAG